MVVVVIGRLNVVIVVAVVDQVLVSVDVICIGRDVDVKVSARVAFSSVIDLLTAQLVKAQRTMRRSIVAQQWSLDDPLLEYIDVSSVETMTDHSVRPAQLDASSGQ